ncbi:glycoside hydrolase family 31 protein, partial [Tamlana crocina]
YYFMYGQDLKEVIKSYTKLTGKPIMPPNWALGWSQSRGMLVNEELTREIAAEYRKRDIPIDIIYQDIGWVEGLQNFEWRKDRYDNPKKMLSDLAEDGFKVIISQDPVISPAVEDQWQEAAKKGFLAT